MTTTQHRPLPKTVIVGQEAAWRAVRAGYDRIIGFIGDTVRDVPELAQITDQTVDEIIQRIELRDLRPEVKRRRLVEHAVWALAQRGWLRLGGEHELVLAAKAWYDCGPDSTDEEISAVEQRLEVAIEALPDYQP